MKAKSGVVRTSLRSETIRGDTLINIASRERVRKRALIFGPGPPTTPTAAKGTTPIWATGDILMRTRPASHAGFTLIELMVVLILIGIFSGLMLAEMRGTYEDALLRATARKIISAANLASSKAITLSRAHSLLIDSTANRLRISAEESGANGDEEESLDPRIKVDVRDLTIRSDDEPDEPRAEREERQRNRERIG